MKGWVIQGLAVGMLVLSGCAEEALLRSSGKPAPFCGYDRTAFVELGDSVVRQGAVIPIRAMRSDAPAGNVELPPRCVSSWKVTGPAYFNDGHRAIQIERTAAPGSEVVIWFRFGDAAVERRVRVVASDGIVLTGTRSQKSVTGCEMVKSIGELEFTPEAFSVTFQPFETYRDYWGTYTYDPRTQVLHMVVTGGNVIPENLDLDGIAFFEKERVVLDGFFLGGTGGPAQKNVCRYVF